MSSILYMNQASDYLVHFIMHEPGVRLSGSLHEPGVRLAGSLAGSSDFPVHPAKRSPAGGHIPSAGDLNLWNYTLSRSKHYFESTILRYLIPHPAGPRNLPHRS